MRSAIWSRVRSSMWVKMDHWLLWGSVILARRSPWNWSAGSAMEVAPAGHGLGVDGVAVGDVQVDEAGGGRVLGRPGVGEHEGGAEISTSAGPMPPWGKGMRTRVCKWGWCRPPLILPMRVCRR